MREWSERPPQAKTGLEWALRSAFAGDLLGWSGYNVRVNAPAPSKTSAEERHSHRHTQYAAEASGLLVIAVLLLILELVRYWQYIYWSAR